MQVETFVNMLNVDFYTGVPDSLLKPLCNYLMDTYGIDSKHHMIAANEGNCTAIAAGYHLATGKVPAVYMQNSGEGNVINPLASLLNDKVYAIPMIFIEGGAGNLVYMRTTAHYPGRSYGKTFRRYGCSGICGYERDDRRRVGCCKCRCFCSLLAKGKDVAFVVKKGALSFEKNVEYSNKNHMRREEIIEHIVNVSKEDPILSTTGKASRELFEIREKNGQSHKYDFLTVGSMGHTSSIALGVALQKPQQKIWCIDGDGAMLMHMGAMAVIGANKPSNLVHIVINNGAHETVGGLPTVASEINLVKMAEACGYPYAVRVSEFEQLDKELQAAKERRKLTLIEVECAIGAREDLGRPTTTALENKENFMRYLQERQ